MATLAGGETILHLMSNEFSPANSPLCAFTIKCYVEPKTFRIITKKIAGECVHSVTKLNGRQLENGWFCHRDFAKGGTLELVPEGKVGGDAFVHTVRRRVHLRGVI